MSWSASASSVTASEALDAVRKNFQPQQGYAEEESKAAFELAMRAAGQLLSAVANDDDLVSVLLSGHANPGHEPEGSWARDTVAVTVSKLS